MEFAFAKEDEEFREEFRQWLSENLVGEYKANRGEGHQGTDEHWDLRLAWEKIMAEAGWLSITWPTKYGGRGGTVAQDLIMRMEYAKARAPYCVGEQGRDLFGPTLLHFGTEEQKMRFLTKICAVEEFWGQGFSEPDAGSDLASLKTRAELDGDHWVINGQKIWMTMGHRADWLYVLCRTDPDAPKHKGISLLMIPRWQDGVDLRPIHAMTGGKEVSEVFFTDARTPVDMVVGPLHGGWNMTMSTLGHERVLTTIQEQFGYMSEWQDALDMVRRQGRADDPLVRQTLANLWERIQINNYMSYRIFTGLLHADTLGPESSVSKLWWSFLHRDIGNESVTLMGADGMLVGPDYELDGMHQTFLHARAETIYGGAAEVQHNIVGERVLGLPR